ncbi:repeat-containing protein [Geobacter metallireducens GS-15]|uniref:Repeat-containing protein n=1 Tax=Geobacter metallireducens (strain ATCC 53774 / DSM 7210 / GS-15) TaxID=269799 RepID=Q39TL7_GEOMG|nr:FG-GAP-like repeat-containing protein [Geobacter metallireducens]ABB32407.1 repeat-containing protein [Geobacter metallireducens GS-15]
MTKTLATLLASTLLTLISVTLVTSIASAIMIPKIVDYDGDGKTDVAMFRPSEGKWYILYSSNNTQHVVNYGISGDIPVFGDFDGDGKTDEAVYRPSEGRWYILRSSNGSQNVINYGISGDIAVPGDYDGDGKTDVAMFRPSEGNWYLLYSSNNTQHVVNYGISGDIPVFGDFDGDGKTDEAVYRPSEGKWYILSSSNGSQNVISYGISGDIAVPGDYDGDGKTDVAMFRPSEGNWYILYSSNNTQHVVNYGIGSDIPAPGDYDGDGKTDEAVYRPSAGKWYILNSSNGSPQVVSYGLPTDMPLVNLFQHFSSGYSVVRQITINGGLSGIAAGAVASLTIDSRALISEGLLRSDRNDLRLFYDNQEIDRALADTGTIHFKVQVAIAANGADSGYCLYYGNPNESVSPKSNRENIYPFYVDGSSTAAFVVTGPTPTIMAMPKPEFLKFRNNPLLSRTPGYYDWKNVRDINSLLYEDGWYYAYYDCDDEGTLDGFQGWGVCQAKSQDLSNWLKLGPILQPSLEEDSGSASGAYVTKIGSTFYMYYLGTPNIVLGVPLTPYNGMLATASAITGPYTKKGVVLPLRKGEFDQDEALINTVWYDGTKYNCLYSAAALGYANALDPSGPWDHRTSVIDGREGIENPVLIHDALSGYYYLFANHVQQPNSEPAYTDSIVMYWSNDPKSWDVSNKTTVVSPGYGAWDGYIIGLLSSLVVRNGVVYGAYDGRQRPPSGEPVWGHEFRDGGFVEAKWPFSWGSRMKVASGTSLRSGQKFGDGTLRITAQMTGGNTPKVGLSDGTTHLFFQVDSSNIFTVNNNGTMIAGGFQRVKELTKTFEIRRSGTNVSYIFDGVLVASTTGPTGDLPISIAGDVFLESITFEPAALVTAVIR